MIEATKILSRYVYPSIKRRLVEILYNEFKMSQKDIKEMLHISQSLISRYLNKGRGAYLDISLVEETDKEIKELAREIVELGVINQLDLEYKLTIIALKALGRGDICKFHLQIDPERDPDKCDLCRRLFSIFLEK